jgi:hypothetical protein
MPRTQVTTSTQNSTVATALTMACVPSSPSRSRVAASKGTKAAETPLGEQAPQQVGNAERHIEGVGQGTGAEAGGDELIPHQAGDAGQQGPHGNRGRGLEKIHGRAGPGAPAEEGGGL